MPLIGISVSKYSQRRIDESPNMSIEAFQIEVQTGKTLSTCIQHSIRVHATTAIRQEKRNKKEFKNGRKIKLPLFADGMILRKEYPKDGTKILLELLNEFSEVMGYRVIHRNL